VDECKPLPAADEFFRARDVLDVAPQVDFESKLWNQDITFQGQGLKPGRFKLGVK